MMKFCTSEIQTSLTFLPSLFPPFPPFRDGFPKWFTVHVMPWAITFPSNLPPYFLPSTTILLLNKSKLWLTYNTKFERNGLCTDIHSSNGCTVVTFSVIWLISTYLVASLTVALVAIWTKIALCCEKPIAILQTVFIMLEHLKQPQVESRKLIFCTRN